MIDGKLDLVIAGNLAQDIIYGREYYGGCAGNIAVNALCDLSFKYTPS